MDVDVPLPVGAGVVGVEDEHVVELLGPLGAELQHGAHGGVPVDVGVLPLDVGVLGGGEGDVLVGLHQPGVHLPGPAALLPVEDVGLGGLDVAVVHEHPLHQILNVLHVGLALPLHLQNGEHLVGQPSGLLLLARLVGGPEGLVNGAGDLVLVELRQPAVPLSDFGECHCHPFLSRSAVAIDYHPLYSNTISCALFSRATPMIQYLDVRRQGAKQKARPKKGTCFLSVSLIFAFARSRP